MRERENVGASDNISPSFPISLSLSLSLSSSINALPLSSLVPPIIELLSLRSPLSLSPPSLPAPRTDGLTPRRVFNKSLMGM